MIKAHQWTNFQISTPQIRESGSATKQSDNDETAQEKIKRLEVMVAELLEALKEIERATRNYSPAASADAIETIAKVECQMKHWERKP